MKGFSLLLMPSILFLLSAPVIPAAFALEGPATTDRAIEEYNRENYEEALQLLVAARSIEGPSARNSYYSGLSRKEAGDYPGAVADLTAALTGEPPFRQAAVVLIDALYNLERFQEAMQWVLWAEQQGVSPGEIAYLKGQLLVREKRYDEAITAFNAARSGDKETDQQVGLQIASAYVQSNRFEEAREALQTVISRNPNSDAATFAKEYDQKLSAARPAKRWSFFLGANYLYDDNVTGVNTGRQADNGIAESVRVEYDALLSGPWSLNAQYSISNTNYLRLLSKSVISQSLSITPGYRIGSHVITLPVSVASTNLDTATPLDSASLNYRSYSVQTTIGPTDTYVLNQNQLFQGGVFYSNRQMLQDEPVSEESRDDTLWGARLGYIHLFSEGAGMFSLRGELAYEDTHGKNWVNLGERIGADLLLPLAERARLILSSEAFFQNYAYENTIYAAKRRDTTLNNVLTLNLMVTPLVYLNLQYSYTRQYSNISIYDNRRSLVSAGFEVRL